jgi:glutathione-regulated potassium-efflux system ancillary protein KefG
MARVLVLFAHPTLERSRANVALVRGVTTLDGVTVNDLYEAYPNFHIDTDREQTLLREHEAVVLQHPLYWYSYPALLKEWIDCVLTAGFAYGGGSALRGKLLLPAITTGGAAEAYKATGVNRYTIRQFLIGYERIAALCGMRFLAPHVTFAAPKMNDTELAEAARSYRATIISLRDGTADLDAAETAETLNGNAQEQRR